MVLERRAQKNRKKHTQRRHFDIFSVCGAPFFVFEIALYAAFQQLLSSNNCTIPFITAAMAYFDRSGNVIVSNARSIRNIISYAGQRYEIVSRARKDSVSIPRVEDVIASGVVKVQLGATVKEVCNDLEQLMRVLGKCAMLSRPWSEFADDLIAEMVEVYDRLVVFPLPLTLL